MKNLTKSFLALSLLTGSNVLQAASETAKFFDSAWDGMGFVLGYGGRDAYIKYACGGTDPGDGKECDGPPEEGMVGKLTVIVDDINEKLDLVCKDIPTTGSKKITYNKESVTVKFSTPNQKIPSAWDGGGSAFDRRYAFAATLAGQTVNMVVEVSCAQERTALIGINMPVGEHAPTYNRPMNVWLGKKGDLEVANVYVSEVNSDDHVRGAYGFALEIDKATSKYKLWGGATVHYDDETSDKAFDAYNLTGNYDEHTISLRVKRFVTAGAGSGEDAYYNGSALAAISGATQATLPAVTTFDLLKDRSTVAANETESAQGCMDFDKATTAPTKADACTGLDWDDAPTPVADADGKFSPAWILKSMAGKLVEVPSL